MNRQEFDKRMDEMFDTVVSQGIKETLWDLFNEGRINLQTGTSLDIVDYGSECSMCGKPMPYRFCGMCTSCEMVWNG